MVRRVETDPIDRDERLGEAIEAYLALGEEGRAPDPEQFAAGYPDLGDDLRDALEGLALVQGLVGDPHGPGRGLESGRRIAGYRIVRELGRGGMGIVYEAVHVGLDRPVALKVLGSHATPDSNGRRRFLNEARTAAGLHHTHIVPVFDVGQVGGLCYYAMQRIEGAGLDRVLRHLRHDRSIAAGSSLGQGQAGMTPTSKLTRSLGRFPATPLPGLQPPATKATEPAPTPAPLPAPFAPGLLDDTASWHHLGEHPVQQGGTLGQPRREPDDAPPPFNPPRGSAYYRWVAEIGRQAAEALAHAHHRGIVHRDIKPSNLLVDARGIVWVADFGLARRLADPSQTQHDSLLGTPRYMSPEQARIGPIDGRSDVYSLGATLYELLTLRPPFEGRTAAELVEQISGREPVPPHRYDARIPRDLETILLKTLGKRPADRYATATDLADDLKRFLNHEPVRARRISPLGRFWRFTRRHPSQTIVSATAAATVLAVLTVAYVRIMQQRDHANQARDHANQASAETQLALKNTEEANRAYKGTLRELLASRAEGVLHSNLPNRRVQGLDLLQQAAKLGPDPALTLRLRDSAVEFLRLADVEARPGFATGATRGVVFAADGTRLAAIDDDGEELSFWDVEGRQLLARPRLRPPRPANSDASSGGGNRRGPGPGSFSGGPYIAAVGPGLASILPNGRGLRLFDAVTGEFVRDLRTPDRFIRALYASAGGDRLVTIEQIPPPGQGRSGRGTSGSTPSPAADPSAGPETGPRSEYLVNLWDPERWAPESVGQPIATLARWEVPGRSTAPFTFPLVAVAPDGAVVATALSRTSTVAFWSAADGDSLGEIETTGEISRLALGPDNLMATAGGGIIQLWDTASETSLGQLTPHQSDTRILRFHPRGTLLAAVGSGSEIELWDPASHGLVAVLSTGETDRPETSHDIKDVTFSPDGRTLVASAHGTTSPAWAIVDPVARAQLSGFDSQPGSLTLRADGLLAVGSNRGAVWFWQTGHCANTLQQARGNIRAAGAAVAPAPNTTTTATAAPNAAAGARPTSLAFDDRGRLLLLDADALQCWGQPPGNTEVFRIPLPVLSVPSGRLSQLFNRPSSMARTPDGRMLFLARQAQILAWHASEPDQLRTLTLPSLPPPPTSDRERRRFDPGDPEREGRSPGDPEREGRPPRDPERERPSSSVSWQRIALAPDGTRLYLVDNWNRVHALALEEDRARWLDWSLDIRARTLTLSPDGRTLAIADRGRPSNPSDGRSLNADRGQPGSVALIDTSRGIETARLLPATNEDEGQISSLAFAPSGHELAAGTQQGLIDVWSLDHPAAPRIHLPGHRGNVNALAFDPQGRHLASGGYDRTVAVWDLGIIRDELHRLGLGW